MTRNIENRVEVATPIYDPNLQKQITDVFDITWNDNVKARRINGHTQNQFIKNNKPQFVHNLIYTSITEIMIIYEDHQICGDRYWLQCFTFTNFKCYRI